MKKFTFLKKNRKLLISFTLALFLLAGGCYKIESIIQPKSVYVASTFDVKINVITDPDYFAASPEDFIPGYAILWILLPEGWQVKDSVYYYKTRQNLEEKGVFIINDQVVNYIINKLGLPPSGYYWWGAKTKNKIDLQINDYGYINLKIKTNSIPGDYKLKYVLGDDTFWFRSTEWDQFGIISELNISDYIPVKSIDTIDNSGKIRHNVEVRVYPNPATDKITFTWNGLISKLNLKLYNVNGACVMDKEITSQENISVKNLQKGMYLYRLTDGQITVKSGKILFW